MSWKVNNKTCFSLKFVRLEKIAQSLRNFAHCFPFGRRFWQSRIACKDRPKSLFLSLLFSVVRNLGLQSEVQNRRQKVINRGAFRVCRAAWRSENLIKTPLIDIAWTLFGGLSPPNLPVATRLCGFGSIIGSFCAIEIESDEQSLVYDFTVCLDSSFCNHEDKKSNSTEKACWVLILPSTFLPA